MILKVESYIIVRYQHLSFRFCFTLKSKITTRHFRARRIAYHTCLITTVCTLIIISSISFVLHMSTGPFLYFPSHAHSERYIECGGTLLTYSIHVRTPSTSLHSYPLGLPLPHVTLTHFSLDAIFSESFI